MADYVALIENNEIDHFKDLLKCSVEYSFLSPAKYADRIFSTACRYDRKEILELALQDPRINPHNNCRNAFVHLCEQNNMHMVELLIADPRIISEDITSGVLINSLQSSAILKLFLSNNKFFLSTIMFGDIIEYVGNCIFKNVYSKVQQDSVEMILSDDRINPICHDNSPVLIASRYGFTQIVKKLLLVNNINPSTAGCRRHDLSPFAPIRIACDSGYDEIASLLAPFTDFDECIRSTDMFSEWTLCSGSNVTDKLYHLSRFGNLDNFIDQSDMYEIE